MHAFRRLASLFALLVAISMLIGSCAPAAQQPAATQEPQVVIQTVVVEGTPVVKEVVVTQIVEVEKDPRFGGVMKAAFSAAAPTLDTMTSMAAATVWVGQYIFETIVAYDQDYKIQPMLAESYEVSPDGKTYTFKFRQGVKFHNGAEMTSADVIASIDRYMQVGPRKGQFSLLESYEALDDYTVAFHLTDPSGSFVAALAYPVGDLVIMPKDVIEGKGAGDLAVPDDIIGTGPYKLKEYKADQLVVLERFDDYQSKPGDKSALAGAKIAYFDEIHQIFVPESAARVAGLLTGDYDFIDGVPETEYLALKDNPDVKPVLNAAPWSYMLLFNHNAFPSSNVKFRQALLTGLDMEAVGMAISSGARDFFKLNPSIFSAEGPWYISDDPVAQEKYNAKNIELAKQLLAESGYNGEEVVLVTNRDYDYMYKLILAVADQMEKNLGIKVKVEVLDWPGQRARWEELDSWNISTTGYLSQTIFNPDALASFWVSTSASSERGFYNNPAMDEAFTNAAKAITLEERQAAFREIQRLYYEDLPNIKLVEAFRLEALRSEIKGHMSWYRGNLFWGDWREK